ncbi:MAG: TonB-dependent receptor [Deltaproteobacteria bacterium]|nr:TonB-dependent receptor [Deltaproteobacteria bacterium]
MNARGIIAWSRPLVILALVLGASIARADDRATVVGAVKDRTTGEPVPGVVITAGDQFAATDDAGVFELELPAGRWTLELTAAWIKPVKLDVKLVRGERRELVVPVEQDLASTGEVVEIVDTAPADPGATRIDAASARAVPGASNDVLKVVQAMPGVARPPPVSGDLVVWGAAPEDTRVFVDGVPVPALYHGGGWRATIGSELVDDVALKPGGFGAEHGAAIGGIVEVTTRPPPDDAGAALAADVLDGSAHGHGKLGPIRAALGGRISWLDRAIDLVAPRDDGRALRDVVPVPRWADGQLSVRAPLGRRDELRGLMLGARDALDRVVGSPDPAAVKRDAHDRTWLRAALTWTRTRDDGDGRLTIWIGGERDQLTDAFGPVIAARTRTTRSGGLRATHRSRLARGVLLRLGLEAQLDRAALTRTGSLSLPPREGDVAIFGQPPGDDVARDQWSALTIDAAPYAAVDWIRGPWTLTPGLRVDGYVLTASKTLPQVGTTPPSGWQAITIAAEPRLSARLRQGRTTYSLDAGLYHQPRAADDASAVFGTPSLTLERGLHLALGARVAIARPVDVELVAYGRALDRLVVRDPDETPPLAAILTQDGAGRVLGAQLVARLRAWHGLSGWVTYALSRSERQDTTDGAWRRYDHDQTHALAAVVGWERGPWSAGGRVRYVTGEPRTLVVGAYFDARAARWDPLLGAHNAARLPDFVQLDVRGERRLRLGGLRLSLYAEVHNATGRANAEEFAYSADYQTRGVITGLPIVGVIGARGEL